MWYAGSGELRFVKCKNGSCSNVTCLITDISPSVKAPVMMGPMSTVWSLRTAPLVPPLFAPLIWAAGPARAPLCAAYSSSLLV